MTTDYIFLKKHWLKYVPQITFSSRNIDLNMSSDEIIQIHLPIKDQPAPRSLCTREFPGKRYNGYSCWQNIMNKQFSKVLIQWIHLITGGNMHITGLYLQYSMCSNNTVICLFFQIYLYHAWDFQDLNMQAKVNHKDSS